MMNKRIHELVRQCGGYHIDDDGEEGKTAVLVGKDVELFAELIVKECANIAFDEYATTNGAESGESAILKHFGVEE